MSLSEIDYSKLYPLQDKVLEMIIPEMPGFYLTGGTALSRFYLNHRFSDDLDFFYNRGSDFKKITERVRQVLKEKFVLNEKVSVIAEDFVRYIIQDETILKLEFVNDVAYKWGPVLISNGFVPLDNPANILSNKLTALVSREEPKDVFDIVSLAEHFSFEWKEIYHHANEKQGMNEIDVSNKLASFPVKLLNQLSWFKNSPDINEFKSKLEIVIDDFLLARENSLGAGKTPITQAQPKDFTKK